jgi:DNA-binding beta-propeller fold protein YncE
MTPARGALSVMLAVLLPLTPAAAEILLPAGFKAEVYVTGHGFGREGEPEARGIPSSSTLAVDGAGVLYLARTGYRYRSVELEDLWPIYRIPPGGARLTPETERRFRYGPPLINPQVAAVSPDGDVFVTTYDRDRRIGVVYRLRDGRTDLFAGGTPEPGVAPLLRQPEGVVFDAGGHVYVADREQGLVLKLDATGRVVNPRFLAVKRPRLMALDERQRLVVAGDEEATAPWQRGPGILWRASPDAGLTPALHGPLATGLVAGPDGRLFVADRQESKILVLAADGTVADFIRFTDGDAPRAIAFVPDTPATRQAGMARDLLIIAISRNRWPVNEIVRVSGPFGGPRTQPVR